MALYASDEDDFIFATDAEPNKTYRCLECLNPVKVRRGKNRLPHFYHLKISPGCRLYSKSEDHLVAQLHLNSFFPQEEMKIERPFIEIGRVADLCWEKEKIIFEIQCSPLTPYEAEARIKDYRSAGYETVWLLDEKRYNKRVLRPAESFLRDRSCYYFSIRPELICYDQFEIFAYERRVKKGNKLRVNLKSVRPVPKEAFHDKLPEQIHRCSNNCVKYFWGDRISRALRSVTNPLQTFGMQNWRALEIHLGKRHKKPGLLRELFMELIGWPYLSLINRLLRSLT
ncbi:MAG: hypothetical protein A3E80_01090 [Chlamydiae bacterium RIFCSPHIGHO2_12_FULL_49_9]|nr:MAG: hypothetical protein A3E80_01090 [Chlamydiae bacterium RIFCSPHIGHO2_12_FULL_49_9]